MSSNYEGNFNQTFGEKWGKFMFVAILIVYVVSWVGSNLSLKISTNYYNVHNAFFQIQFMHLFYIICGLCVMIPMQYIGWKNIGSKWGIDYESRKWKNHIIYFCSALFGAWEFFAVGVGGNGTSGDYQTIIRQLSFPLSILLSLLIFKQMRDELYACMKNNVILFGMYVFSILLFIGGICVGVIPSLYFSDNKLTDMLIFSSAPFASVISWLLKESLLKQKCSAIHLMVWNEIYVFIITFGYWAIQTTKTFGGISLNELFETTLVDGWYCFTNKYCQDWGAFWSEIIYAFTTLIIGFCTVIMCKQRSSAYLWAMSIFAVPITCLFYLIPNLPVNVSQQFSIYTIFSIVMIMCGMVIYHITDKKIRKSNFKIVNEPVNTNLTNSSSTECCPLMNK